MGGASREPLVGAIAAIGRTPWPGPSTGRGGSCGAFCCASCGASTCASASPDGPASADADASTGSACPLGRSDSGWSSSESDPAVAPGADARGAAAPPGSSPAGPCASGVGALSRRWQARASPAMAFDFVVVKPHPFGQRWVTVSRTAPLTAVMRGARPRVGSGSRCQGEGGGAPRGLRCAPPCGCFRLGFRLVAAVVETSEGTTPSRSTTVRKKLGGGAASATKRAIVLGARLLQRRPASAAGWGGLAGGASCAPP